MRFKGLVPAFLLLLCFGVVQPAMAQTPTTVSNLMELLKEEKQKATYNVHLNAPFSKDSIGIKENISTETGELSLLHTLVDLPGRNGMDLVLQAEYRNRDAKLFNEGTRAGATTNNYGQNVVAYYDVFDQNGYWLRTGGLIYTPYETIAASVQYGQENWVFTGNLTYESGGAVFTTGDIYNATAGKSKALSTKYILGEGWALDLPFLDVEGENVYVHLQDGSTYKVDFNKGNGLEQYELSDLVFDKYTNFGTGNDTAAYRLYFRDGDEFFFSTEGYLIGQRDRFKNTIRYYYEEVNGLKVLAKIEDTVGRVVEIGYNESGTVITSGKKRITLIKRPIPGQVNKYYLSSFIDPAGREIKYQYTFDNAEFDLLGKAPALNTYANLVEIRYPTGAKTVYHYTKGRKNLGQSGSMEYFKIRERYDQDGGRVVNRLSYQYANEPDGYPTYKDVNLIPDTYRYESRATNNKGLTIKYTFDGRHLPIKTQEIGTRLLSQTDTVYHGKYKLPVQVRERNFNAQGSAQEKVDFYEYDSRGNVIVENHPTNPSEYGTDERKVYSAYDFRYNLLLSKKYKQDANTTVEVKYTLTPDGRELSSEAVFANGRLLSRKSYTYDDYGNITTAVLKKSESEDVTESYQYAPEYGYAYLTAKTVDVKDADGNVSPVTVCYTYDFASGNKIKQIDGRGNAIEFKYDLLDRVVKEIYPYQTDKEYQYDDSKNIVYVTDEKNNQTIYYYDGLGKLVKVTEPQLNFDMVNLKYDELENVVRETNPKQNYKEYTYDQANRLIKVGHYNRQGQNLNETQIGYDEAVNDKTGITLQKITVTKKADPGKKDLVTNYYFDSFDRLLKLGRVQGSQEHLEKHFYDYLGNRTEVIDLKGNRTRFAYDGLGRLKQVINALGKSERYVYDYLGNQVAHTDPLGNTTFVDYDGLGRVTVQKAPFKPGVYSVSKRYYDEAGNLAETVDPEGAVTKFQYNKRNLLTAVEKVINSRESDVTKYEYDAAGNRTEVQKGLSSVFGNPKAVTKYEYDSLGRIISFTDPMGKKETYEYDANSNVINTVDRNGNKIDFTYDGLDRIMKKQAVYNGQLEKVEFSYDKLGNRTKMEDSSGITSYEYDDLGRLEKISRNNGISLAYAYDLLDRKLGMTLTQTGEKHLDIRYEYDKIGKLTRISEQGRTVRYQYDDANSLVAQINEVTGVETKYNYNSGGMMTGLLNKKGEEIIAHYEYEYDKRGNQIKKVEKDGTSQYYYDSLSRLKTAILPNDVIQDYSYDKLGNLGELIENQNGWIKETSYLYNKNSQLLLQEEKEGSDSAQFRFEYDANGNQLKKDEIRYRNGSVVVEKNSAFRYDAFNQLREVTTDEGKSVRYTYNGDGMRTRKEVDDEATDFTYDGQDVIFETDGIGAFKAKNFFGLDLVSRQTADDIYYYLFNGHGDVTHLLNEKGDILKDYRYDPFGKDVQEPLQLTPGKTTISLWRNEVEKLDNPFRYAGEYLDQETGYYYLRARYYDPQIQRFISEDSYAKSPTWTELVYAYAEYNPVNLVDPTGHDAGNAGRDYSKRIVNKSTKTTAKNYKKSSGKSNTVTKAQVAVKNREKPQVKSVTRGIRNNTALDKAKGIAKGLVGIWVNRINNARTQYQNTLSEAGIDPDISGQAFDATAGYVSGETLVGAVGTGAKTLHAIKEARNAQAFKKYMDIAEKLDVSTERNQAVFWSGRGNRELAEAFARENSKVTLEMTPGGRYLDELQLFSNNSPLTTEQARQVWIRMSHRYAEQTSGTVVGFVKGARPSSIFNTVEYPVLSNNPNVVNVITGGH